MNMREVARGARTRQRAPAPGRISARTGSRRRRRSRSSTPRGDPGPTDCETETDGARAPRAGRPDKTLLDLRTPPAALPQPYPQPQIGTARVDHGPTGECHSLKGVTMSRRFAGSIFATIAALCFSTTATFAAQPPSLTLGLGDGGGIATIRGDLTAAGLPGLRDGSVAWRDYDGDGDLDFLLVGTKGSEYLTRVYRNDGGGRAARSVRCRWCAGRRSPRSPSWCRSAPCRRSLSVPRR